MTIELSGSQPTIGPPDVSFDNSGSGERELTAWPMRGAQTGFLAFDRDGDGRVTSGRELFGRVTPQSGSHCRWTGVKALAELDGIAFGGNRDGRLDARDKAFASLLIWFDSNHDGVADPSEVLQVRDLGIQSIDLAYTKMNLALNMAGDATAVTGLLHAKLQTGAMVNVYSVQLTRSK